MSQPASTKHGMAFCENFSNSGILSLSTEVCRKRGRAVRKLDDQVRLSVANNANCVILSAYQMANAIKPVAYYRMWNGRLVYEAGVANWQSNDSICMPKLFLAARTRRDESVSSGCAFHRLIIELTVITGGSSGMADHTARHSFSLDETRASERVSERGVLVSWETMNAV